MQGRRVATQVAPCDSSHSSEWNGLPESINILGSLLRGGSSIILLVASVFFFLSFIDSLKGGKKSSTGYHVLYADFYIAYIYIDISVMITCELETSITAVVRTHPRVTRRAVSIFSL